MTLHGYFGEVTLVRLLLQRGLALIYLVAFVSVLDQGRALLGSRGLLPIPSFLAHTRFREAPSLFHWRYSDRLLTAVAATGALLSAAALLGLTEAGPLWLSVACWLTLYGLYLSVVNVGQTFFGFGWESMLLEAGFFAAFLGSAHTAPSLIPVLILRWMLFRTELGAGLIKLRHDTCWRDLTCLYFHYETQPLPNPLSRFFHRLPKLSHRLGIVSSHFVQIIVPFGLFAPQPWSSVAALLCIGQQLWLILSGNYAWLNWLTVVLGFAGLSDAALPHPSHGLLHHALPAATVPIAVPWHIVLYLLAAAVAALSVQPVLNLFSPQQRMNYSYNRYHLVNTYGAFGSVGRERFEIVLEGTRDRVLTPTTTWSAYGFRAKPGDPCRRPPQIAPYHLRLDWLLWFLPFTVQVTAEGIRVRGYELWFVRFLRRLLTANPGILRLMGHNPFPDAPPIYLRALFYRYHFASAATHKATGAWWTRELLGTYLPPVSLDQLPDA